MKSRTVTIMGASLLLASSFLLTSCDDTLIPQVPGVEDPDGPEIEDEDTGEQEDREEEQDER